MKKHITILLSALLLFAWVAQPIAALDEGVVAKGVWTKKSQRIAGSWEIVERDGGKFLVFDDKFKTKEAPDLKVFLSPLPIMGAGNSNAMHGATLVAALPKTQGALEVKIPNNVKLDKYMSVLIHCEQYGKLWGGADLPR